MISREGLEAVAEYACHVVLAFFPGLALMDGIYGKGLFSGSIDSLYEFLLLLSWGLVLSLPFHFAQVYVNARAILPPDKQRGRFASMLELPFSAGLALLIVLIFKVLTHQFAPGDVAGIHQEHILFLVSFSMGFLVSWPLAKLYGYILAKLGIGPVD